MRQVHVISAQLVKPNATSVESKAAISLCVDQPQPWQQHKYRTHDTAQRQHFTCSRVSDRHSHAQYFLLYGLLSCSFVCQSQKHSNYNDQV